MSECVYLMHHGIKGMKWGVRRTPEQLGYRDAKRLAKQLNRLDQRRAELVGAKVKASEKNQRLAMKFQKQQQKAVATNSKFKAARALRTGVKLNKEFDKAQKAEKEIQEIQNQAKVIGREIVSKNYNMRVSSVQRSTLSAGEKVLQGYLASMGTYYDRTTPGMKFKADKTKKAGRHYFDEMNPVLS